MSAPLRARALSRAGGDDEGVGAEGHGPDLVRLATWARLERRPAGHLVEDHTRHDDPKLRAIAEVQRAFRA